MTRVSIVPVSLESGELAYHAQTGDKQSRGKTAGEALDTLTAQLQEEEAGTLVVVQHHHPDTFFSQAKQERLAELMARWRSARDSGNTLSAKKQAELDALVEEELNASAKRTAALLHHLDS